MPTTSRDTQPNVIIQPHSSAGASIHIIDSATVSSRSPLSPSHPALRKLATMELSDVFRIVNLVVAAITVVGGIAQIFDLELKTIVVGTYMVVFGLSVALLEFQIPPLMSGYASILSSFIARGAVYIFVGSLLLGALTIQNIAGAIVGIIGVGYVALEFIPSIEPPSNMREADAAGWGAEEV
ncbi:Golgi apparatus membrane protein tvp15 [Tolypocladium ophioglossoides CBS 100239]|uniref:Golgi apparatus membrane protein tvp15 n=1 Tax=Tolypocladium ophioglossoides (strain CBS 100239) TaxID=1163406 RepID=A0A0L0NGN4_TOLOC|nr:Golgi apparatus membrane protein tvp15 [Tolypocladium ophioglossoides CBS 100239]